MVDYNIKQGFRIYGAGFTLVQWMLLVTSGCIANSMVYQEGGRCVSSPGTVALIRFINDSTLRLVMLYRSNALGSTVCDSRSVLSITAVMGSAGGSIAVVSS